MRNEPDVTLVVEVPEHHRFLSPTLLRVLRDLLTDEGAEAGEAEEAG